MHEEVLSRNQKEILPLIKSFSKDFFLIGGTATALHLGHRRSIDYDLATNQELKKEKIKEKINKNFPIEAVMVDEANKYTIVVNKVKVTFIKYPFKIKPDTNFKDIIKLPNLLSLGATKAYSLGRRAKWKDYVDIYFILQKHTLNELVKKAGKIFRGEFNEKLFREQLTFFEDIDYSEKIDFLKRFEVDNEQIKKQLTKISLQKF